ncbi:uncharacterized protein LOC129732085 [Wyeomyia smithii]|uniref:uncharacterized protein LOC129732085 n=1 Tax=Wyeomyia smithii TaxID=174621 RepID=UPI0024682149|nr:uncharacterized protein LOC129732085 [Wyeomyia smithii]
MKEVIMLILCVSKVFGVVQKGLELESRSNSIKILEMSNTRGRSLSKQIPSLSTNPQGGSLTNGCQCINGICSCCTGIFSMRGCMNLTYIPEDFAFDFRMLINNRVLYKNKITGRNPPPVCVNPPRLDFVEVCARFYDLFFVGRNMHVCMEMNGSFEGFELFSRQFNCLRMGDKGIKVLKPGESSDALTRPPGLEAEIDAGTEDIDDYEEAVI